MVRASTWGNYKNHNTIKFLIGTCPQGAISFISKAWGGCTSDKYLTENCHILNRLLSGDIVLADRGLNINESVALKGAKLELPKGKHSYHLLKLKKLEDLQMCGFMLREL